MTKRPNAESWMHDGDDFRVSKEHTVKKHTKKRIGAAGKGHPAVKVTEKGISAKKTTRKRVAGK